jgi:hypothetical protein
MLGNAKVIASAEINQLPPREANMGAIDLLKRFGKVGSSAAHTVLIRKSLRMAMLLRRFGCGQISGLEQHRHFKRCPKKLTEIRFSEFFAGLAGKGIRGTTPS